MKYLQPKTVFLWRRQSPLLVPNYWIRIHLALYGSLNNSRKWQLMYLKNYIILKYLRLVPTKIWKYGVILKTPVRVQQSYPDKNLLLETGCVGSVFDFIQMFLDFQDNILFWFGGQSLVVFKSDFWIFLLLYRLLYIENKVFLYQKFKKRKWMHLQLCLFYW